MGGAAGEETELLRGVGEGGIVGKRETVGLDVDAEVLRDPVAYEWFAEDRLKDVPDLSPLPGDYTEEWRRGLQTQTGKIEFESSSLKRFDPDDPERPPIMTYRESWEGPHTTELFEKYPLQLISAHYKQRTHSTYGNVPWMKEAAPQVVWINPIDAEPRGINNGDMVVVYNDRGRSRVSARVTPRIIPGVAHLSEGAWYSPDSDGVDQSGCANILTRYRPSPLAKGDPMHTCLVQVEKA